MPATTEELLARLDALELATTTHRHAPLFTVADSKQLRGELPGGHCKSLYLRDKKKRNWLVVTLEDRAVDLKALAAALNTGKLSFGSPDRLMEFLGVTPGSVTPFALINDPGHHVTVVLDAEMLDHDVLNYHPLVNTATTAIAPAGLLAFIRAGGHEPVILRLA